MKTDITLSSNQLNKIICNVSTSKIYSFDSIFYRVAFKDWGYLSHTISYVNNNSCILSLGVKTQNSLGLKEKCRDSKRFKENLCNFSPVLIWI